MDDADEYAEDEFEDHNPTEEVDDPPSRIPHDKSSQMHSKKRMAPVNASKVKGNRQHMVDNQDGYVSNSPGQILSQGQSPAKMPSSGPKK